MSNVQLSLCLESFCKSSALLIFKAQILSDGDNVDDVNDDDDDDDNNNNDDDNDDEKIQQISSLSFFISKILFFNDFEFEADLINCLSPD